MNTLQVEQELKQMRRELDAFQKEDPFLTPKEVAQLLKIGLSSVYTLFQKSDFPGRKIAGSYRVRRSRLYKYYEDLPTAE